MKEIKNALTACALRINLRCLLFGRRSLIRHSRRCHDLYLRYSARLFLKISRVTEACDRLRRRYLEYRQEGGR